MAKIISYFFYCAVFLDATNIAFSSLASLRSGAIPFFLQQRFVNDKLEPKD